MKLLTLNFLTCALKSCKPLHSAFPLHIRDAELEAVELDFNPLFLRNVCGRIEWGAMRTVLGEVGLRLPGAFGGDVVGGEGEGAESTGETGESDVGGVGSEGGDVEMGDTEAIGEAAAASGAASGAQTRPEREGEMAGLQKVCIPNTTTSEQQQQQQQQEEISEDTLRKLHELLMETQIVSGKLVCGNCGHEYAVREGIPNFLLPAHLV